MSGKEGGSDTSLYCPLSPSVPIFCLLHTGTSGSLLGTPCCYDSVTFESHLINTAKVQLVCTLSVVSENAMGFFFFFVIGTGWNVDTGI